MTIVAHVDPGVHGHAMAVGHAAAWDFAPGRESLLVTYEPGELLEAAYAHSDAQKGRGPHVWCQTTQAFLVRWRHWRGRLDALVVEVPQIYAGKGEEDPNDLIQVVGALGVLVGALQVPVVVGRYPREWKKQQKKSEHHARVREQLTPAELERVEDTRTKADREDLWDAVALQKTRGAFMQLTPPG